MGTHNCIVSINNLSTSQLFMAESNNNHGNWKSPPPATIQPKQSGIMFELDTQLDSPYGADGIVIYAVGSPTSATVIKIAFSCPTSESNSSSISINGPNTDGIQVTQSFNKHGTPLTAQYTISN